MSDTPAPIKIHREGLCDGFHIEAGPIGRAGMTRRIEANELVLLDSLNGFRRKAN